MHPSSNFLSPLSLITASILSLITATSGAPASPLVGPGFRHSIERPGGEVTGRLIVTLKPGVSKSDVFGRLRFRHNKTRVITHEWDSALNGFAGQFDEDEEALNYLRNSESVESIVEDGIVTISAIVTQTNAPWGLSRLSSVDKVTNRGVGNVGYNYTYNDAGGKGVDIYVVDTGLRATHRDFGGRARLVAVYGGYQWTDDHGHGTHVAAIAGGTQFGLAKAANILGVRVLSNTGSGSIADVVSGLNYVMNAARSSGRPSVASLSFAANANTALDNAVSSLINSGVHVAVAAGNGNVDARTLSPARVSAAITVSGVDITDTKVSVANYGSVVDVFAPAQNIISAWHTSDTATNILTGTSMAAPHVAGLIAYFISFAGNTNPAAMQTRAKDWSLVGVLNGIPSGTPNYLITNSYVCNLGAGGMMICI